MLDVELRLDRVQEIVRLAQAVGGEAAPDIVPGAIDHTGFDGVGLNIPQHPQQMSSEASAKEGGRKNRRRSFQVGDVKDSNTRR